jgi:Tol biopolymer transport system component
MKLHQFLFLVLVISFVGFSTGFAQQSAEQLYQSGLYQEEIEGDLKAAIKIYESIISKYPDNRPVAAKTYLQIGLCYEKLGLEEAQKAYRKVVDNYPEQTRVVALARENLNRLLASMEPPHTPTFRKINIPTDLAWTVKLSPDGKNLLMASDKKLWALPLEGNLGPGYSGTPVQINTEGTEVDWTGLFCSYDGKWIAFNDYIGETDYTETNYWIYIVPSVGGKPKKVFKPFRGPRVVNFQISISPDGKNLAFSKVTDDEQYIYSIPVEGGTPKKLAEMEAREPVYSPDGKLIAFAADRGIGRGEGNLGLWVVPAGGGTPHLVADAVKATNPIWSPDGHMIAYVDEEEPQLFIVRVDNTGEAIGDPVSFDAPEGTAFIRMLAGWTPDNKMGVLLVTEQESAIYSLPVQGGQAAMIQRTPGAFISQPRWSPDSKRIYYSTPPEEVNSEGIPYVWTSLASVPASGGNGKPVPGDLNDKNLRLFNYAGGNRVSPDGKTMIAGAWTAEDVDPESFYPLARIWKIALDGTGSTQLTKIKGQFIDTDPCWSPDGTKIAFIRHNSLKGKTNDALGDEKVYIIDSSGGAPELLDSIPSGNSVFSLVWSPDGNKIACFIRPKEPPITSRIFVFNIENKTATEIGQDQSGIYSGHCELAWSPDSKRIAFNYNDDSDHGIKIMTLSDESVEDIETGLPDLDVIVHFDWSPDGNRFVFTGWKNGKKEFWLMEDFISGLE